MKPKRIQRKRTKGWRMPENTVNVTRPGKWGNPLKLVGDQIFIHAGHRRKYLDPWVFLCMGDMEKMLKLFKCLATGIMQPGEYDFKLEMTSDLLYWVRHFRYLDWAELKDKNLMCFCSPESSCHADVLLEIVNQ